MTIKVCHYEANYAGTNDAFLLVALGRANVKVILLHPRTLYLVCLTDV